MLQIRVASDGRYHWASRDLHVALTEIETELRRPRTNWHLVAALTGVKSYIAGKRGGPHGSVNHFWSKVHGQDGPYRILDGLHHEASWRVQQMPSGMTESSGGPRGISKREGEVDTSFDSPTLRLIAQEHAAIEERCRQQDEEVNNRMAEAEGQD